MNNNGSVRATPAEAAGDFRSLEEAEAALSQLARAGSPQLDLNTLAAQLSGARPATRDARDQLRTAEARYHAIVEQIPAVCFMAPLDGSVGEMYISPQIEQLLGF